MADPSGTTILRQLRFVVASWKEDQRTDVELLNRFIQTRDEQAFSTLVGRHSELVWGVCLRVLKNPADAQDALQATFLRLARDAHRIIKQEALAGWLYRVARDCAIDLRRAIARQRRLENRLMKVAQTESPSTDLRVLLDDELDRLPLSERAVIVLVCLEGRTYADAALELQCSIAAVHRRLVRAQTRLRRRLIKKYPNIGGAVLTPAFFQTPEAWAVPPRVLSETVATGLTFAHTGLLPVGRITQLVVPSTSSFTLISATSVIILTATAALAGALLVAPPDYDPTAAPATAPTATPTEDPQAPARFAQLHTLTGRIGGANGQPIAQAEVTALVRQPFWPGERGLRDVILAHTTTNDAGEFTLHLPAEFPTWFQERVITLQATAPGWGVATVPVRLNTTAAVQLHLRPARPFRGRLVDGQKQPIPQARVDVVRIGDAVAEPILGSTHQPMPPGWPEPVWTNSQGEFVFSHLGSCENVWIRVNEPHFAIATFRLDNPDNPAERPTPEFVLERAVPLTVEVLAADTGLALHGARVSFITDRHIAHPHFCTTEFAIRGPRILPADIDTLTDHAGRVTVPFANDDQLDVLVYPPHDAGPYLGVRQHVDLTEVHASEGKKLTVKLPRGQWLTGQITDAQGQPLAGAAVHWGPTEATKPEWRSDLLTGRDAIARTDPAGNFRLALPPGPATLRVYGPNPNFIATSTKLPGNSNTTLYAHAVVPLEVPATGTIPPLSIALTHGRSIHGRVLHPTGDATEGWALASGRVSPVRGYAMIPLPIRNGAFTIPGCKPDTSTRIYILDPVACWGGIVDATPSETPTVALKPCGGLQLRVRGPDHQPLPNVSVHLALLVQRDRPQSGPEIEQADPQPVEWFDAVNYPTRPKTNHDGLVELKALIPGARYSLSLGTGAQKMALGTFTIEPGRTHILPDVVVGEPRTFVPGDSR
ncbi:MAG: sigma-70 family RNA polymerase sigma factor [Gemmataceae bacterium]|nr:sigma-70 family RNA polymerase sigma factor [Gemmata sp.]MDW8198559.1 sigma-70 family RNA polymerase sigma factor [Gemmataceae bacterium]